MPAKRSSTPTRHVDGEVAPLTGAGPNGYPDGEFYWSQRLEPHDTRTKLLLTKYGDRIRALMGPDSNEKWWVLLLISIQLVSGVIARDLPWWGFLALAYVGGIPQHSIFLAIHELSHHMAFKTPIYNDLLAMFASVPIGIPYAMPFKHYHSEHHRYQGWDGVDTDVPTAFEASLFSSFIGKLFFCTCQIFFYALRPMLVRRPPLGGKYLVNFIIVVGSLYAYYQYFGPLALLYLYVCDFMAGTINPVSGHFVAEHYLLNPKGEQETFSYYGFWNCFTWNVGCHNEHHDFPNIPYSRLFELKKIAPEFYEPLQTVPSWFEAQMQFIFDDRASLWCRIKREKDAGSRQGPLIPTAPFPASDPALDAMNAKGTKSN